MTIYEDLVNRLRKYYDKAPMVIAAADAIQSLDKRCRFLESCIDEALDGLDRGVDNDYARKALEKAESTEDEA